MEFLLYFKLLFIFSFIGLHAVKFRFVHKGGAVANIRLRFSFLLPLCPAITFASLALEISPFWIDLW